MAMTSSSSSSSSNRQRNRYYGLLMFVAVINFASIAIFSRHQQSSFISSCRGASNNNYGGRLLDDVLPQSHLPHPLSQQQPRSDITLVGMSYSDNTTSDTAIHYIVDAACNYGITAYILLAKRDEDLSLQKKVVALVHHYGQSIRDVEREKNGNAEEVVYPECMKLIRVGVSPGEEEIYRMTKEYYEYDNNNSSLILLAAASDGGGNNNTQQLINNPLDRNNRIARIKRSRELQRQDLMESLMKSHHNDDEDWKMHSAIAVLDLDLLAYPSPSDLVETAYKHIFPSSLSNQPQTEKFHAICSNGLMTIMSQSKKRYVTRYYDTYSTILLPNAWLHNDRMVSSSMKDNINEKLSNMDQIETFHYILEQGKRNVDTTSLKGSSIETTQYDPVPVRSCFNGLTIYRADVYLNSECRYDTYNEEDAVYASNHYQHACEHVVMHECLRRKMNGSLKMAVKPDMKTLWHVW